MPPQGLVFRDSATLRATTEMRTELEADLTHARGRGDPEATLVAPLLSAAALEGAVEDAAADVAARTILRNLTDRFADAYWHRDPALLPGALPPLLLPDRIRVSRPEGFAYYALVPRALAQAAVDANLDGIVTVVGLRTIGVALAAVVRAALGCERFTVRPQGHPYDRTTTLDAAQSACVRSRSHGTFIVTDEGPGLSGSSLLSAAEALVAAGARPERTWLLGTRVVEPETLVTRDGPARWRRFRTLAVPPGRHWPAGCDGDELSGGAWRARFWADRTRWPAAWTALERCKRLSADGRRLWKFEGLARYGAAVHARSAALAAAGWAPTPEAPPDGLGLVPYRFARGVPLAPGDGDRALAATLGRYCAARAALFPAEPDVEALSAMARTNVALESGVELPGRWQLPCERPVLADARMLPHEWLRAPDGRLWKCDAAAHGDDHLYPGPVDVAWDLAGAIVEWGLGRDALAALIAAYHAATGDDPTARLPAHELAYAAFRACASAMAAAGSGAEEAARLRRDRERYRRRLRAVLAVIGLRPA